MPRLGAPRGRIYSALSSRVQSTGCYLSHCFHNSRRKLVLCGGGGGGESFDFFFLPLARDDRGWLCFVFDDVTNAKVTKIVPHPPPPLRSRDTPSSPSTEGKKFKAVH